MTKKILNKIHCVGYVKDRFNDLATLELKIGDKYCDVNLNVDEIEGDITPNIGTFVDYYSTTYYDSQEKKIKNISRYVAIKSPEKQD